MNELLSEAKDVAIIMLIASIAAVQLSSAYDDVESFKLVLQGAALLFGVFGMVWAVLFCAETLKKEKPEDSNDEKEDHNEVAS